MSTQLEKELKYQESKKKQQQENKLKNPCLSPLEDMKKQESLRIRMYRDRTRRTLSSEDVQSKNKREAERKRAERERIINTLSSKEKQQQNRSEAKRKRDYREQLNKTLNPEEIEQQNRQEAKRIKDYRDQLNKTLIPEEREQQKRLEAERKKDYREQLNETLNPEEIEQQNRQEAKRIKDYREQLNETLNPEEIEQQNRQEAKRIKDYRDQLNKTLIPEEREQQKRLEAKRKKDYREQLNETLNPEEIEQQNRQEAKRIKDYREQLNETLNPEDREQQDRQEAKRIKDYRQLLNQTLSPQEKQQQNRQEAERKKTDRENIRRTISSSELTGILSKEAKNRQQRRGSKNQGTLEGVIEKFKYSIQQYPEYVCTCCRRLLYHRSVSEAANIKFVNVQADIITQCITGKKSIDNKEWLCSTCMRHIKKDTIPPQANCNDLAVTPQPPELAELTPLERRLISRRYPFMKLIALPKGQQSGIKGSVVNVPVNEDTVCSSLPRTPNEAGFIPLKLKRKIVYKGHVQFQYIRPVKVQAALKWLRENNFHYRNVEECNNWEDRCEAEDQETWASLTSSTIHNDDDVEIMESPEHTPVEVNQEDHNSEQSLQSLTETDCTNDTGRKDDSESEDDYTEDPVSRLRGVKFDVCIQPSDPAIDADKIVSIAPGEGKRPINFLMDDNFEELAFPHLLPNGKFGWKHERPVKLSAKKYFQKRILDEDQTFASDVEYLYVAQCITETKQVLDSMNIAMRKSFSGLTPDEVLTAGKAKSTSAMTGYMFRDQGYRFLQPIRGSPPYWQKVQYKLLSAIKQLGIFTWFFTLSAADLKWNDTIQAISRQRGIQSLTEDEIQNLSWNDRCSLLRSNPVTAARHFQYRLDCLFKDVILSKANPLGEVLHYFYRIEFQQRGSPHCHGVLWIKDAPHPETSDSELIQVFINKYVQSTLPIEEDDPNLYQLVNTLQKHTHTSTCVKTGKMCRFHYPKPISSQTVFVRPTEDHDNDNPIERNAQRKLAITMLTNVKEFLHNSPDNEMLSIEEVLTKCNLTEEEYMNFLSTSVKTPTVFMKRSPMDILVNNYNPTVLKSWQANMDIQYVSNAYACIQYLVSYITKEEREMGLLLQAVSKENSNQGVRQQMKKCAQAFSNSRTISAQEAAYRLLGLPLNKSDFTTVWIPTGLPHQRVRLLKRKAVLQEMDDDDENIFSVSLDEKYALRPKELDSCCLALFASWYAPSSSGSKEHNDIEAEVLDDSVDPSDADTLEISELPNEIVISTKTEDITMKKRSKQALIRYHVFSLEREPESYYHSELYLFKPWRNEASLLSGCESFAESYRINLPLLQATKQLFQKHAELIDAVLTDFTENGPQTDAWDILDPVTQQAQAEERVEGEQLDPEYSFLDPGESTVSEQQDTIPLPNLTTVSLETVSTIWTNEEYSLHVRSLNFEQRQLFQAVTDWCQEAVNAKREGKCPNPIHFFVSGGAGTGKSHLIKAIYQMIQRTMRIEGDSPSAIKTLLLAPTGAAAHNIEGNTIHSALQIQIGQSKKYNSYGKLSDEKRNILRNKLASVHLIIIDEISMVGADLLLQIHRRFDELFQSPHDFGGISVLAFGDMYQLPPVGQGFVFQQPSDEYARLTVNLWDNFKLFELKQIMRQKDDAEFARLLNRVREAKITEEDVQTLKSRCVSVSNDVYPKDTLHVYAWNEQVDAHNCTMLNQLDTEIVTVQAIDKVPETLKDKTIPTDPRYTGGLPYTIALAIGARIMLIRNVDVSDGLTNGAQGTIVGFKFSRHQKPVAVLIKFDNKKVGQNARILSKYDLSGYDSSVVPVCPTETKFSLSKSKQNVHVIRSQFPLRLAWATTIHKIQGQSLDSIVVSFDKTFRDGQAYVALSRARKLDGLHLTSFDVSKIRCSNPVAREMKRMKATMTVCNPYELLLRTDVSLKVVVLNARSARLHFQDILVDPALVSADILCLSETHFLQDTLDQYHIPGYKAHFLPCNKANHGLAIYSKLHLETELIQECPSKTAESIHITVEHPKLYEMAFLYRSPSSSVAKFLDSLPDIMPSTAVNGLLIGDFNIDPDNMTVPFNRMIEFFTDKNYKQLIHKPTTIYGTMIDLVFSNSKEMESVCTFASYYTDHRIVCYLLENSED